MTTTHRILLVMSAVLISTQVFAQKELSEKDKTKILQRLGTDKKYALAQRKQYEATDQHQIYVGKPLSRLVADWGTYDRESKTGTDRIITYEHSTAYNIGSYTPGSTTVYSNDFGDVAVVNTDATDTRKTHHYTFFKDVYVNAKDIITKIESGTRNTKEAFQDHVYTNPDAAQTITTPGADADENHEKIIKYAKAKGYKIIDKALNRIEYVHLGSLCKMTECGANIYPLIFVRAIPKNGSVEVAVRSQIYASLLECQLLLSQNGNVVAEATDQPFNIYRPIAPKGYNNTYPESMYPNQGNLKNKIVKDKFDAYFNSYITDLQPILSGN
jgi:hypothetical protein